MEEDHEVSRQELVNLQEQLNLQLFSRWSQLQLRLDIWHYVEVGSQLHQRIPSPVCGLHGSYLYAIP